MYRWTRHVYDASRKYYLLGRDHLIQNLNCSKEEVVCEVGCGTARNLIKMANRYKMTEFCGIDASDEMLKTARRSIGHRNIKVYQGLAEDFDAKTLFHLGSPLDKIVFSYALSIIPPWRESIDHALTQLKSGGEVHIVDFGGQNGLPGWFRAFLFWWLRFFHVYYKPEILAYLQNLKGGSLKVQHLYKGYAYYAVFTKA